MGKGMNEHESEVAITTPDPLADIPGAVDVKLEEEGEWFGHPPADAERIGPNEIDGYRARLLDENGNGLRRLKVRSIHCKAMRDASKRDTKRAARIPPGPRRDDFLEDMRVKHTARLCLLEWEFTDRAGNEIPLSPELVEVLLTENRYRFHGEFIRIAIATQQGDIERSIEEDSGN